MLISYFRPHKFICLLLVLLSGVLYASDVITIKSTSSQSFEAPINSIKLCPALDTMIEDNGGYAKYRKDPLNLPDVTVDTFVTLAGILGDICMSLDAKDIKEIEKPKLQAAIEKHIKLQAPTKVLEILTAASSLEAKEIVKTAAMAWAINYSAEPSSFNALDLDAMREIIEQLTPKQFLALVKANDGKALEEAFKVATVIHFEEEPKSKEAARMYYEELEKTSEFVRIPGREYYIGIAKTVKDRARHRVSLAPYWIGKTVVGQKDYSVTMEAKLSKFSDKEVDYPVGYITLFQAQEYAKKRSDKDPKWNYTLVPEEQWEAAARADSPAGHDDVELRELREYVYYFSNSNEQTHPIRSKLSNAFGVCLYGNISEWVVTEYHENFFSSDTSNPMSHKSGLFVFQRAILSDSPFIRVARCVHVNPEYQANCLSFRLLRTKKSNH